MKKTANYDLNQWEKPDRILMDDFNADNAKIDGALKANAAAVTAEAAARAAAVNTVNTRLTSEASRLENLGSFRLIKTYTSTADATTLDVPLNGINWGNWNLVVITVVDSHSAGYFGLNGGRGGSSIIVPDLTMHNMTNGSTLAPALGLLTPGTWTYVFFPMRSPSNTTICLGMGTGITVGQALPYKDITSVTVMCSDTSAPFPAGMTLSIWGAR